MSYEDTAAILLPATLRYPITITKLLAEPDQPIPKHAPLFTYSYVGTTEEAVDADDENVTDSGGKVMRKVQKNFYEQFDSPLEGKLDSWSIHPGLVLHDGRRPVGHVREDCSHAIQFAGLCAMCGKDVTGLDFTGNTDSARATINMAHNTTGLTVSREEAARIEKAATSRLLEAKKLSLIVDLDLTVIQAAVDPTVGRWIADPTDPNHGLVKDVGVFQLASEPQTNYYIKERPLLKDFLQKMSNLFEMHVYTMGSRPYANAVTKIIDPDRKIFGDRILSRDENGTLQRKSVQRLFPEDDSLVVIIDDRADVWQTAGPAGAVLCPNVVKVKPFDFFPEVGDINGAFVPRQYPTPKVEPAPVTEKVDAPSTTNPVVNRPGSDVDLNMGDMTAPPDSNAGSPSLTDQMVAISGGDNAELIAAQETKQHAVLLAQQEQRPLEKMQESMDPAGDAGDHRVRILRDNDRELQVIESILKEVHSRFYSLYERGQADAEREQMLAGMQGSQLGRAAALPAVKDILPAMKQKVLKGCVIVFSSIIPLGEKVHSSYVARMAMEFGAKVQDEIDSRVTHVIAGKLHTVKVNTAAKHKHIKIVSRAWFDRSIEKFARQDETPYVLVTSTGQMSPQSSPSPPPAEEDIPDELLSESEHSVAGDDESAVDSNSQVGTPGVSAHVTGMISGLDFSAMDAELAEFLGSDDDGSDGSISDASSASGFAPDRKRKRRQRTISATSSQGESDSERNTPDLNMRSPLAKRQRRARERKSALAHEIGAEDTEEGGNSDSAQSQPTPSRRRRRTTGGKMPPTAAGGAGPLDDGGESDGLSGMSDLDGLADELDAELD
ncbi:CTD phosphatase Fcp1 [Saitoella coloradoensis]